MKEELRAETKRKIIERFLHQIMQENPSYYYAPTADVAREIHLKIKETLSRLPLEEQLLLRRLSVRDVEVILSLK